MDAFRYSAAFHAQSDSPVITVHRILLLFLYFFLLPLEYPLFCPHESYEFILFWGFGFCWLVPVDLGVKIMLSS